MKTISTILSIMVVVFMFFFSASFSDRMDCGGKERWAQKTLTDPEAKKINWTPIHTTISALEKLYQPYFPKKFNKELRYGNEYNTYEVTCKIREFRIEDDGDYHLVLMDLKDTTLTIIGEIPNPECDSIKKHGFYKTILEARKEFEKHILPNNKVKHGHYQITGVCFYDRVHGQLGVSVNNGIELHPIMDIVKNMR